MEEFMNGKVTYRQQYTRCGKERCRKCKEGAGHGPYWYAYWSENGRTVSKYIGIHPPTELKIEEPSASFALETQPKETSKNTISLPAMDLSFALAGEDELSDGKLQPM